MKKYYELALSRIEEALERDSITLDLSFLRLNYLPQEVCKLKNLMYLDLSHNFIQELPEDLNKLQKLVSIDLSYNLFNYYSIKDFDWLFDIKELILDNNPILNEVPFEIVERGYDWVINYYESAIIDTTTKLYETKLLIVGNGEVGKTTLMKKLMKPSVKIKIGKEPTTHGIGINRWNLACEFPFTEPYVSYKYFEEEYFDDFETDLINDREKVLTINYNKKTFRRHVKLNMWDFGGQEIYHATHQFFLTKRSVYLFVWEARKEEEYQTFEYWLNIIKYLSFDSPVILIMNKSDVRIKEIDEYSLRKKFPNIKSFLQISCSNGEGIKELINEIKNIIKDLPHLTDDLPTKWLNLRENLQQLKKNYISIGEYYELCYKWKFNNEQANFLSDYFHDLGVLLHFKEDKILQNIVILKPEWATNALYQIIDDRNIQKNKGKFSFDDLKRIWDEGEYPVEKHFELMRLMEKFELCFNLVGTYDYIIPELLPSHRPSRELFNFEIEDRLKFEYRYKFMPAGILSRLTCRLYHLVHKELFWKDGAILRFESSYILLLNEKINKKLTIIVIGNEKSDLLSIIRSDLDFIHKSVNLKKGEDFKEMIPCFCKICLESNEPEYYEYPILKRFEQKGKEYIDCYRSTEEISVKELLNGFEYKNAKIPILQLLITACSRLQQNHKIISNREDDRNSFIASLVDVHYVAKDQTRAGSSESGKYMGELDLLIETSEKMPKSVFEAFNLQSLDNNVISKHLNKIFGYDSNGLKENFIVVYCDSDNFLKLTNRYREYIDKFIFPYPLVGTVDDISERYSYGVELKIYLSKHKRNNEQTKLFHLLVNLNFQNTHSNLPF